MIVGITGGTGCGKTTALQAIRTLGGEIMDCDAIYHELLATDSALIRAINTHFPEAVEGGKLNRKTLAKIVFSNPERLRTLNDVTHAFVKAEVERRLAKKPRLAAIDAIALFEGGLAALCDVTVAVTAPEDVRVARLIGRDAITRAEALARIRAPKDQRFFAEKCDYTLENNGTAEEFAAKCVAFFQKLDTLYTNLQTEKETLL